ncbi:MAG: S1 RNA-binding domain-containing protein [Candidatus Nealsonbacteria bacterium]|nr:S1 RNA-binding domain-containing protein [Candidatus Nealsonbacteria bacterium]
MEEIVKDKGELLKPPRVGEIVRGRIIGRGRSSVFVDLGNWGTGIIYGREFLQAKDILKKAKEGDELFTKIVDLENEEGFIEVSALEADREISWLKLKEKRDTAENIPVKILGANKGGLLATVMGVNAFLPVSQLSSTNYPRVEDGDGLKILKELQKFIGQEMEVKILDLDPRGEKLILSEKIKETEKIKEILKNYEVGNIVEGEITGVVDFGAFVKFGPENLEGLIHISELDWQLIENPGDVVRVGEKVNLKIIDISNGKVSLSLRALKEDPWKSIEKTFEKGKAIRGKVTKFNPFGAFIEAAPKIQGLCHISEFGNKTRMEEVLQIGSDYDFEVLLLDIKEHRLLLKLKSVTA